MRYISPLLLAFTLLPMAAAAQVSTDNSALDALKAPPTAAPSAKSTALAAPATHPAHPVVHHTVRRTTPAHPAKPAPLPVVPLAPPLNPVIVPPPLVLPVHPRPPPPPVPIKPDAIGDVTPIKGGVRLTFGPDSSDLNPALDRALLDIASQAKADPLLEITVTAWAPGTNEDPSTPRRLSLDRALAARAVLINAGIVSERVHAVAEGFIGISGGPPDRAEVVIARPRSAPPGTPVLPPSAPGSAPKTPAAGAPK